MVKITINVLPSEDSSYDWLTKQIEWLAVPRKDEEIDLCNPGFAGGATGIIFKVKHWLGTGEIDVYCKLSLDKKTKEDRLIEEEEQWKGLIEDGWKS